ncbi:scavenger receptor class A member 3 [Carassius gibelio]|uniref:scavenger receptor class A member 3 n=1 Tax=Carassius gibelio TaxID=101364 RepID=UPI002279D02A|nr:scavenger receptor class A member 3 [Carassius gibelio]XP_052390489.1 scavenger receptor class A member 3 [Carassius gibelio]
MKDYSYNGYENQLFNEEDLTGEEEEIPPLRGRARGGCMKCQQTHSLQLAVKMLYGFLALLIIAVAVLASLVFRRVDNLSKEETFSNKQISKVQESIKDISAVNNNSNCLDVAQYQEEIARLKKEYEDIHRMLLSQEQKLDQATQSQQSLTQSSNRMTRDLQSFGIFIKRINQSLGQYLDQVNGWQVVINETDQGMKTFVEDQYDLKATMKQINTTVALSALWIGALQRKAEEETLVLQKITSDWQNYSRVLSALKSNASMTTQTVRAIQNSVSATHQRISMSSEMVHDLTLQVINLQMQLDNVSSYTDEHEENMHDHQYHAKYYENRTRERFVTLDARIKSIEMEIDTLSSSFKGTVSHVQSMYQYINQESSSCQSRLNSHTEDLQNINNTVLLLLHLADTLRMQYMMMNVRLDADVRNLSMVIEEMKLVDTSHAKLIQNVTILKGVSGPPGPKGNRGESGGKGPVGVTGPKGDRGLAGNRGSQGVKGAMGIKGDQGVQGPSGIKGGPGLKGEKGSLGPPGFRGEKGQKGDMGASGKDGIPGPRGVAGIRGEAGLPGVHGLPGPVGVQGPVGPQGPRGIPGPPGEPSQSS